MGRDCIKCNNVEKVLEEPADIFLYVENQVLTQKLKSLLDTAGFAYEEKEDQLSLRVENFKDFLTKLYEVNNMSDIEMEDVWLVNIPPGESVKPNHIKNAKPLKFWLSQIECQEYLEILERKSIIIHFQPIVDKTLSIIGYECLMRGISKDNKLLSPAYLLGCAERTNSIFYLDRLCREKAIITSFEKNIRDRLIFINFVPTSIYDPETCLRTTTELVEVYNLNPENIVFEVVESQEVEDIKHLTKILDYYRARGFKVALDDVGTGFSGLFKLINIKPDIIKIDKEIVRNIHGDLLRQDVVKAIVDACGRNEIKTLAEGVETLSEYDFLCDKVDYMQGFLFAKPSEEPVKTISIGKA